MDHSSRTIILIGNDQSLCIGTFHKLPDGIVFHLHLISGREYRRSVISILVVNITVLISKGIRHFFAVTHRIILVGCFTLQCIDRLLQIICRIIFHCRKITFRVFYSYHISIGIIRHDADISVFIYSLYKITI